jgi:hypothetical protein
MKSVDNVESIERETEGDVKPKRGRPKVKTESEKVVASGDRTELETRTLSVEEPEVKVKAKRGRKPLNKVVSEEVKIPKKRGRKPKERIYAVSKEPILFCIDNISDNLLHLDKINKDDFKIVSTPTSITPIHYTPYEPFENNFQTIFEPIKDKVKPIDLESSDLKLLPQLYSSTSWPLKTNIYCWWCCHRFDTVPIPLPTQITRKKCLTPLKLKDYDIENFEVKGCFCSFNCALSFSMGSYSREKQYLVLYFLKKIYKLNNPNYSNEFVRTLTIKPAPPKEVLEIFGGPISISKYRESLQNSTIYNIIDLPSISSKQYIDIIEDKHYKKRNNDTLVKTNILLNTSTPISKPTPTKVYSKNTLEHLMSMQIIH